MPIQTQYRKYQQAGWPGFLARPNEPNAYDVGMLYVPTNGTPPEPGMGVLYDAARDAWRLPTTAAEATQIVGLLSYDPGTVTTTVTRPAGANSDAAVQFADDDRVKVAVLGTFFVIAGSAMEYGDQVRVRPAEQDWEAYTVTISGAIDRDPIKYLEADVTAEAGPVGTLVRPTDDLSTSATNAARTSINTITRVLADSVDAINTLIRGLSVYPAVCVSRAAVASGGIAEVRIGYGRRI